MADERLVYIALLMVIVMALGLSYLFFAGPFYSFDDGNYIAYAHQVLNGTFSLTESPYAYGFFVPLTIATTFSIFGVNVFASILPALLEYLGIIILAFAIAKKLYGSRVGLVSAFLVATAPFVLGYSTRVLPDMLVGLAAGLSIFFFVYASEMKRNGNLFYFLSGVFAALTIYVKFIGLAFVVFFFASILLYQWIGPKQKTKAKRQYCYLYPLAGLIVFILLYAAIFQVYGGGFIAALTAYGHNQNAISPTTLGNNVYALTVSLFGLFGYTSPNNHFAPLFDPQVFPLGLLILFAILGTLVGILKKDRASAFLSVILWGVFLYLFFGTVTLSGYSFITVISRYFIIVSIPVAVLASYSLCWASGILSSRFRTRSAYIVSLLLLAVIISDIPVYNALYNYNASISGDIRSFSGLLTYLESSSHGNIVTLSVSDNGNEASFMRFLLGYGEVRNIDVVPIDFSSEENVTNWASKTCGNGLGDSYFALAYSNYSEQLYETVFQNWVVPHCSLTEVGMFQDNLSAANPYNGMDVEIKLYRINT